MNRHLSRTIAMQSLYEWDMRQGEDVEPILDRNINEFEDDADSAYVRDVVNGTVKVVNEIDNKVATAAPEWPVAQISPIDKAILRVAIYELLYSEEVPPKVAINEAVELAKMFGGENSSKFINGVLGTLYRGSEKYTEVEDAKGPSGD
jgi:transcription antitermination protein NusB